MTIRSHRPSPLIRSGAALLSLALLGIGCGDDSVATATEGTTGDGSTTTTSTTSGGETETGSASESDGTTTDSLPPAVVPEGCNPIAYEHDCMLPYPTDYFSVADPAMPNGARIELTPEATPRTMDGLSFNFLEAEASDGASHHMPILALFPEGIDTSNLNFHLDGGDATLTEQSPTLVMNAETGELIPHWVELDVMASKPGEQALIVRTFDTLEPSTRYIVAFQGLVSAMGTEIEPPMGFAHLVAGEVAGDPVLEPLYDRYQDEVFGPLEEAGVAPDRLQLAWDFTTASEERNTRDMLTIRDDIMATFADEGPPVMIDKVLPDHNDDIALRLEGRIQVPLYLDSDEPMARLSRDGDGNVVSNGDHWVKFTFQVPTTAFPLDPDYEQARIIQFGHGFFGEREEINWSAMRGFSVERGLVMVATEWVGMAFEDQPTLIGYISSSPAEMFTFTDRLHQAFANQLALSYAIKTTLAEAPETQILGQTIYDSEQLYWYGISQGSIFGTVFMALTPTIERAALSVGGGPYSLMMTRSGSFSQLFDLVKLSVGERPLEIQKFVALSQHAFDRVDPSTYAKHIHLDPYPGAAAEQVLFQYGIGDHSVNNLSSHVLLRAAGIDMLEPSADSPYGVGTVASPAEVSAAVAVDYNLDELPGVYAELPSEPADEDNVHELVRRNPMIRDQLDAFFATDSVLANFCDGPCDPE